MFQKKTTMIILKRFLYLSTILDNNNDNDSLKRLFLTGL